MWFEIPDIIILFFVFYAAFDMLATKKRSFRQIIISLFILILLND